MAAVDTKALMQILSCDGPSHVFAAVLAAVYGGASRHVVAAVASASVRAAVSLPNAQIDSTEEAEDASVPLSSPLQSRRKRRVARKSSGLLSKSTPMSLSPEASTAESYGSPVPSNATASISSLDGQSHFYSGEMLHDIGVNTDCVSVASKMVSSESPLTSPTRPVAQGPRVSDPRRGNTKRDLCSLFAQFDKVQAEKGTGASNWSSAAQKPADDQAAP